MNIRKSSTLMSAMALVGFSAQVQAQVSVSLPSVSFNDPFVAGGAVNANNVIYTVPVTNSFHMSGTVNQLAGGVITRTNTSVLTTSSGFRMRSSANPTIWADFTLSTGAFSLNTAAVSATTRTLSGPLNISPLIAAGSNLTFEAYNSVVTGAVTGAAESIGANISFNINSVTAPSAPVESFSFAGPFNNLGQNTSTTFANSTLNAGTASAAGNYFLNSATVFLGATISNWRATNNFFSDLRVTMSHSALPGLIFQFRPWNALVNANSTALGTSATYSFSGTAIGGAGSGTLLGGFIPTGGTYSFSFEDAADDVATGSYDMDGSMISFGITGTVPPTPSLAYTASAPIPSYNALYDANNAIVNLGTVSTAFNFGPTALVSATATQLVSSSTAAQIRFRVRSSAYPGIFADYAVFSNTFSLGTITQTRIASATSGALVGVPLPVSSTLSAEFYESTDDAVGTADASLTALSIGFISQATATFTATSFSGSAVDLGDINEATAPAANPFVDVVRDLVASSTQWYKFTISSPITGANARWLDMWTRNSSNQDVQAVSPDPEIALYASNGLLIAVNDDIDVSLNYLSGLSIGLPRTPTVVPISNGLTADRNLPAGTYYIGAQHYLGSFAQGFVANVTTNSMVPGIKMAFRTNLPAPVQIISGNVTLGDTLNPFAAARTIGYEVKQGTTTVATGTVSASTPTTSYSITLPSSLSGAATIEWDGASFLLRKSNVTLTGSNQSGVNASLQNGDVDNSSEVDAADIDAVIADFGGSGINTDVDASGEVDAADIDIVIANFGGVND